MKYLLSTILIFLATMAQAADYLCDANDGHGGFQRHQMQVIENPHSVSLIRTWSDGLTETTVYRDSSRVALLTVDGRRCSSTNVRSSDVWMVDYSCPYQNPYSDILSVQDHLLIDEKSLTGEYRMKWVDALGSSVYGFTLTNCRAI